MAQVSIGRISFVVDANTATAQQQVNQLVQLTQQAGQQIRVHLSQRALVDTSQMRREIAAGVSAARELHTLTGRHTEVIVDTSKARQEINNLTSLMEAATRGAFRGGGLGAAVPIGTGFGAAAAAAVATAAAVAAVTGAIREGITASIDYNRRMELLESRFRTFAGSLAAAREVMESLREYANWSPFGTQEVMESGAAFIRVARGSQAEMMRLVQAAGQLAAINPMQGLEGATFAIQELLAGQSESIANRFNVSRTLINQLRDQGYTGIALIEELNKRIGATPELVEKMSKTFEGRMSTVKSILQDVGGAFTSSLSDRMSVAMGQIADYLQKNQKQIEAWARGWGEAIGIVADAIGLAIHILDRLKQASPVLQVIGAARGAIDPWVQQQFGSGAGQGARGSTVDTAQTPTAESWRAQSNLVSQLEGHLNRVQKEIRGIDAATASVQASLAAWKIKALEITQEYAAQNQQLQLQISLLTRPNFALQRAQLSAQRDQAQAGLDLLQAGPSADVQAQAAYQRTFIRAEQERISIAQRRMQLAYEEQDINTRGRSALEEQARAAQRGVQALQDRIRVSQQARQDEMDALREQQRAAQELRQEQMQALRERLDGEKEARQAALEGIRDVIRAEQERREDARRSFQEQRQDADALYDAQQRAVQRLHQAEMQVYQDRIQAIRDGIESEKQFGETSTQRAIRQLEAEQRISQQRRAIREAERAVATATTITGQIEALARLQEIREQQAADNRRAELQERLRKEQEEQRRREFEAQREIAAIQREQRVAERAFQQQQLAAQIEREQEMEQRRLADRAAEAEERQQRRAEELQLRQEEQKNREADRAAEREIRAQEIADRAAEKAEEAEMRQLEAAHRAAARAEQEALHAAQRAAQALQEAAEEENYQRNLARQQELDKLRMRAIEEERKLLDVQAAELAGENTPLKAQAAAAKARADYAAAEAGHKLEINRLTGELLALPLRERLEANAIAEATRLETIKLQITHEEQRLEKLKLQKQVLDDQEAVIKRTLEEAKQKQDEIFQTFKTEQTDPTKGPTALDNLKSWVDAIADIASPGFGKLGELARNALDSVAEAFKNDQAAATESGNWVTNWMNRISGPQGLQISSPSRWAITQATEVANGFVVGFQQNETYVGQALFDLFNNAWANYGYHIWYAPGGLIEQVGTAVASMADSITKYSDTIGSALITPFSYFVTQTLPTYSPRFEAGGEILANAWIKGWNGSGSYNQASVAIARNFDSIIDVTFPSYSNSFKNWGINLAYSFQTGWQDAMRTWQPFNSLPATPSYVDSPGGRAIGGDVFPGRQYRINEGQQYGEFYATGRIIPPEAFAREVAGALGGMGTTSNAVQVTVMNGAIQVSGSVDENGLGERIGNAVVRAVSQELLAAQRSAPHPVSRLLPGGA